MPNSLYPLILSMDAVYCRLSVHAARAGRIQDLDLQGPSPAPQAQAYRRHGIGMGGCIHSPLRRGMGREWWYCRLSGFFSIFGYRSAYFGAFSGF